jgi:hypothetical protein
VYHCPLPPPVLRPKLGNPSTTCFTPKQDDGCRRVSRHRLHLPIDFEAEINKPPPLGFEAQKKEIIAMISRPKSPNCSSGFEARPLNYRHWFEGKPENPRFSSAPCVRFRLHTVSPDLPIIWLPSTQLVPDHRRSPTPSLILLP